MPMSRTPGSVIVMAPISLIPQNSPNGSPRPCMNSCTAAGRSSPVSAQLMRSIQPGAEPGERSFLFRAQLRWGTAAQQRADTRDPGVERRMLGLIQRGLKRGLQPLPMPVPPARPRAQTTRPPSPAKPTTQEVGSAERKRPATLGPSLCGQTRTTAPRHTQLFSCRPPDPDTPIGDAPTTASLPQHGVQHRHRLSSAQHQFRAGAPPRRDGNRLVVSPDGCSTRTVICMRSLKPSFS